MNRGLSIKLLLLFFLLGSVFNNSYAKERVWVDYDLSMGKRFADVDDGFALISAITASNIEVAGLLFGFGNTNDIDFMEQATIKILNITNRNDLKFYRGGHEINIIFVENSSPHLEHRILHKKDDLKRPVF